MKITTRVESYELNNLNCKGREHPFFISPNDIKAVQKNYPPGMIITLTVEKGTVKEIAPATVAEASSYVQDEKAAEVMKATTPATDPAFITGKQILEQNLKEKVASEQKPANPPAISKEDIWSKECAEFKALLISTKRWGIENFLKYLETETDFYIAPSSTKYHDANAGGLLHHSLKVYHNLVTLSKTFSEDHSEESLIIIGLLHDLCKTNFYKTSTRNVKKELPGGFSEWVKEPYIDIEDQFPLGHGEKSVILIQRHIKLTDTEIMGIRWHMMAYGDVKNSYAGNLAITNASDKFRIIPLMHIADLSASFLEMREGEKP
jgi:hypothetical protein